MPKRLTFLIVLASIALGVCSPVTAQVGGLSFPGPGPRATAGVAYTGPGDIATFQYCYGLRAYSSATRGNAAINLCDNTGANCSDVATNASTGVLNAPGTHGANNCATSNTCLIAKFYDQTGGGANCTQITAANMPTFNNTAGPLGTTPTAVFAGPQTCAATVTALATQPFSGSMVAERTGSVTSYNSVIDFGVGNGDAGMLFENAANTVGIYAGALLSRLQPTITFFIECKALSMGRQVTCL
jgi:hypothetical protein